MIRVNLAENAKKRGAAATGGMPQFSLRPLPVVHFLIFAGAIVGGYLWYASLNNEVARLDESIKEKEARKKALEETIKTDQVVEGRKKALEARLKVVRSLRANQVSPVVALDKLAEAIRMTDQPEKKQFVWLSRLDQTNATFNMTGISSSVLGVAEFIANLEATGYFRNITQFSARDDAGNFNFTLTCEFSPPGLSPAKAGAN